jgi:hypothetical protein
MPGLRPSIRQAQTDPRTAAPSGPFAGDLVPDLGVFSEFVTTLTDAKRDRAIDHKIKIGPDYETGTAKSVSVTY